MEFKSQLAIAFVLLLVYVVYRSRSKATDGSSTLEPPAVYPRIPFIGHGIGMMWGKFEYLAQLR